MKKLICPLLKKCEFSVDSTKKFKEKFLNDREQFNLEKHQIFSIDAVSLFTSINVSRTIEFILDCIYDDLDQFFPHVQEVKIAEKLTGIEKIKDTTVIFEDNQLNLRHFRKPNSSDCMVNFKHGVSPKSYKFSTLIGEVYRANNCTTTKENLDESLDKIKVIFEKNLYPKNLIKSKINEVLNRDFGPSPGKLQRLEDNANPDLKQVFMSLPYTSFRCSKIASQIHRTIKKYTLNFQLEITFQTFKLSSIILPRLKPQKDYFFNSDNVYKFECP